MMNILLRSSIVASLVAAGSLCASTTFAQIADDVKNFAKPTDALKKKGAEVYASNCAVCHGDKGGGDGPGSQGLTPAPRNFTKADGWKFGRKVSEIYTTLMQGSPGTGMAAYDFLQAEERFALAHFIREFAAGAPEDTDADLAALSQKFFTGGGKTITITMDKAKAAMLAEAKAHNDQLAKATASVAMATGTGKDVFSKVALNPVKVISAFSRHDAWRASEAAFVNFASKSLQNNGLSPKFALLPAGDISALFAYLNATVEKAPKSEAPAAAPAKKSGGDDEFFQ